MAQRVEVHLVDDIDGKPGDQTVSFGLDGVNYDIDLSDKNAEKVRAALAPYVAVARRTGKAPSKGKGKGGNGGPNPRDVRAWAKDQGMDVPDRGRIPAEVTAAYESAAH